MKLKGYLAIFFTIVSLVISFTTQAQCAMCKGSVQTSDYAKSINHGIEYLLLTPILLVGAILFFWIKNKDKFTTKEN